MTAGSVLPTATLEAVGFPCPKNALHKVCSWSTLYLLELASPFVQRCVPSSWTAATTGEWDFSSPDAGLGISLS